MFKEGDKVKKIKQPWGGSAAAAFGEKGRVYTVSSYDSISSKLNLKELGSVSCDPRTFSLVARKYANLDIAEKLELLEAYAKGQKIQSYIYGWVNCISFSADLHSYYRVKPQNP